MSNELLIPDVQKHPSLSNFNHVHCHNRLTNDRLWASVGEVVNLLSEEYRTEVEFIKQNIDKHKIVIFGLPWQTDTRMVKFWLGDLKKAKYWAVEIDLLDNQPQLQEVFYRCSGGHSLLPYVFINGIYVGSRHEILELDERDKLEEILAEPYKAE